jgi:hypothetical protein
MKVTGAYEKKCCLSSCDKNWRMANEQGNLFGGNIIGPLRCGQKFRYKICSQKWSSKNSSKIRDI